MFKSYFFIPASKKRFLEKVERMEDIDYRVFDLEDSILESDLEKSIDLLLNINVKKTDCLRIPLSKNRIRQILGSKIKIDNYVIPKFEGYDDIRKVVENILSVNPNAKFILLLENAKSYIELEKILLKFNKYIHGISLGIHDFTFKTGIENDYVFLRNVRMRIMILARAYSVEPIDVVSTNLNNENTLKKEIFDGFKCGYRSKFFIHPFQLKVLKSFSFYTKEEVVYANLKIGQLAH
jgi:citrate lyase beta subunit